MTGREIYDMGGKYGMKSTVTSSFVPDKGCGPRIHGTWVERDWTGWLLDFHCSVACNALGHGNVAIHRAHHRALAKCIGHIPVHDWYHEDAVLLMKRLAEMAPIDAADRKVFLCNSGAEAVESAIKVVQAYWHRNHGKHSRDRFVGFQGGFHGRTLGALSLNASKQKHVRCFFPDGDSLSAGFHSKERAVLVSHLDFPEAGDADAVASFEFFVKQVNLDDVAAVFIELVQGEGGIRVAHGESIRLLVDRCREHGVLVIVDEVQTGLYRTGTLFTCGQYGFQPDIICLAKALGGTMPLGAIVARADLDFSEFGQHSNTFGGGPVACATSLAFLSELDRLDITQLRARVDQLAQFAPDGLGLMRRVMFPTAKARDSAVIRAMEECVWVIAAGTRAIRLMPPLNITEEDLADGIERLRRAFAPCVTN